MRRLTTQSDLRLAWEQVTWLDDISVTGSGATTTTFTYDASGNQTGRGSDTFTWDHENRMTQAVIGGATSSCVYNGAPA
jgi:hypothetical protein